MDYHISYTDPSSRFIQLKWTISQIHQDMIHIQLPAWRPGRYELQNYAKNVRNFSVKDKKGKEVAYKKTTKDRWELESKGTDELIITYEYFANQLDAGASFLCDDFLYINPVNCMMYMEGRMDEEYTLTFDLPKDYQIASQLEEVKEKNGALKRLLAHNFDYLADSPLIASASLEHHTLIIPSSPKNPEATTVHFWFQGRHPFEIERLKEDTLLFAKQQIDLFEKMPCRDYHFLYLMLDYPFRHGVEHLNSTVIAMGSSSDQIDEEYYNDLLGISSHEFFHLWNIKRIRPMEMMPYDFTKENYSTLGYVYEGITTYYGDLMLMRSGAWTWEQYASSLENDLTRHFTNEGRNNYSVAESSWDTWLDGYTPGIPARKVSIYMEGLIAAMIADVLILKSSNGKNRLDHVLHELFNHDYQQGKGYSEQRYKELLEKYSGISFDSYFNEIIWGKGKMEKMLNQVLKEIGCVFDPASLKLKRVEINSPLFDLWSGVSENAAAKSSS